MAALELGARAHSPPHQAHARQRWPVHMRSPCALIFCAYFSATLPEGRCALKDGIQSWRPETSTRAGEGAAHTY